MIPAPNYTYPAAPVRIVDGDTIVLLVDNGYRNREEHSIRLVGVDAPELFSGDERAAGAEWRARVETWIADATAEGVRWPLVVRTERDKQTFNRYLGTVWRTSDGACLNDDLLP